ncbi:MAG: hypothetical protein ABIJ34_00010 [archaeon]|nr:hypothetical protein [Candidatus Micrarchaeota archaeon]
MKTLRIIGLLLAVCLISFFLFILFIAPDIRQLSPEEQNQLIINAQQNELAQAFLEEYPGAKYLPDDQGRFVLFFVEDANYSFRTELRLFVSDLSIDKTALMKCSDLDQNDDNAYLIAEMVTTKDDVKTALERFEQKSQSCIPDKRLWLFSDGQYIEAAERTPQAQMFFMKYPDAVIYVDRSEPAAVDFRIDENGRHINLRIFMEPGGLNPTDMFVDCNDDIITDDITDYLEKNKCEI